jgi:hypothetical protein
MMHDAREKLRLLPANVSNDDILGIIIPKSKSELAALPISGGKS